MEQMYAILFIIVLSGLAVGILFGLIRAIIGPTRADRMLGINMIGSLSTAALAVLAVLLKEAWLLDVCLVYCMISFLATVVLAKVHISVKNEKEDRHE